MNITEWISLPPAQFAKKLRDAKMTRDEYDRAVASILADQRMVEEMRAAGTLPTKLPEGKLGDSLSYGVPQLVEGAEQAIRAQVFSAQSARSAPDEAALIAQVAARLPKSMRLQSRQQIGQVVFMIKHTPRLRPTKKSERPDLLRRVISAAKKLDALHAELHREHSAEATDIRSVQLARRRMKGRIIRPELELAECGLSRDALGHVLAAVVEHMSAIEVLHPTERKRPRLPHGRVLRNVLFDAYAGSGLAAPDREEFCGHLGWLLELVGLESTSAERLTDEMTEFKPRWTDSGGN